MKVITPGSSPCGAGWDSIYAGWKGVSCCANGHNFCDGSAAYYPVSTNAGRVKFVALGGQRTPQPGFRGDLADLAVDVTVILAPPCIFH